MDGGNAHQESKHGAFSPPGVGLEGLIPLHRPLLRVKPRHVLIRRPDRKRPEPLHPRRSSYLAKTSYSHSITPESSHTMHHEPRMGTKAKNSSAFVDTKQTDDYSRLKTFKHLKVLVTTQQIAMKRNTFKTTLGKEGSPPHTLGLGAVQGGTGLAAPIDGLKSNKYPGTPLAVISSPPTSPFAMSTHDRLRILCASKAGDQD